MVAFSRRISLKSRRRSWALAVLVAIAVLWTAVTGPPPAMAMFGTGAARLDLIINDQFLVPWGYVHLSYSVTSFQPDVQADLYLALLGEDGALFFWGEGSGLTTDIVPYRSDFLLADCDDVILEGDLPESLPSTRFVLFGVLTPHGTPVLEASRWLSDLASLTIVFGNLSGEQKKVLAERGNPHRMNILILRETRELLETWSYGTREYGSYEFRNGSVIAGPVEGEGMSASNAGSMPTILDPGWFTPTTAPADIRGLLGDPDHVVGYETPGVTTWLFDDAGVSVTVTDGAVSWIGAD